MQGTITILVLLVVLAGLGMCKGESDQGGPSTADTSPAPSSAANEDNHLQAPRESIVGMDMTPRPSNQVEDEASAPGADAASNIPATPFSPYAARIVDSRKRIVLQSGPKMSSKNVAKIDTGTVVQVIEPGEKWVQVRTDDGLVGYVRATQLETL